MFKIFKKIFQKKPIELSEFEIFKFKKIAKKVYQLNYDLTHDKKRAKNITKSQLQEVYSIDKNRFNKLYTKHLRIG